MPEPNTMNTAKGKHFQTQASHILANHFGVAFLLEHAMAIGYPAKPHKFDLVSVDGLYVGESKNYSWTEGGNVPSAKMAFINEAVFYLQHIPGVPHRFVVLRRDTHERKAETLAAYYYRSNKHLLKGVFIVEIDLEHLGVQEIGR